MSNQKLVQELILASAPLHLEPGDFLIREGDKPVFVPFLLQGIVRGFLFDINGREICSTAWHPGYDSRRLPDAVSTLSRGYSSL